MHPPTIILDHPANDDERISNAGSDLAVRPLKG
jgi:hypothetical protein